MSKKLLLADDSITIQKVIGITFANEDYELSVVDNGDAGLETARKVRPDLILADVFMPGKNGYELCAAVKQDPALAATPVLLLTGTFEPFDENKARAAGADSWIAKPFESQALIDRVEELLSRPPVTASAFVSPAIPAQPAPLPVQPIPAPLQAPPPPIQPAPASTQQSSPAPDISSPAPLAAAAVDDDLWGDSSLHAEDGETPATQPEESWSAIGNDDDLWGSVAFDDEESIAAAPAAAMASPASNEGFAAQIDDGWGDLAEELAPASIPTAAPVTESTAVYAGQRPVAVAGDSAAMASETAGWSEFDDEILSLDDGDILEEEDLFEETDPFGVAAAPEMAAEPEMFDPFLEDETPVASSAAGAWELTDDDDQAGSEPAWTAPAVAPAETSPAWDMEFDDSLPAVPDAVAPDSPALAANTLESTPLAAPAPLPAAVAEERVAALGEAEIARIVEKVAGAVIERLAQPILEKIVWEVVPDLAEAMIRDEIRLIKESIK